MTVNGVSNQKAEPMALYNDDDILGAVKDWPSLVEPRVKRELKRFMRWQEKRRQHDNC